MKKEINRKANKVESINRVHSYLNEKVPLLIEELKKGFSVTKDEKLFKKDREKIEAIIDRENNKVRVWLDVSKYSIWLNVDDNYKVAEFGCNYFKKSAYLCDSNGERFGVFQPLELVTIEQLLQAENDLEVLENEKREIRYKIDKIKEKFDL